MKTILVVDDEFGMVEALRDLLTDEGYRVVSAANGTQGLERLETEHPDLVMLDVMMPVMGGLEALRAIRALPNGDAQTPVILMSAIQPAALDGLSHQFSAFLRKPFELRQLLDLVDRLIGRPLT
jgi:CheY-like chemotaxis protein